MCCIAQIAAVGHDRRTEVESNSSTGNDTQCMEVVPATRFELVTP